MKFMTWNKPNDETRPGQPQCWSIGTAALVPRELVGNFLTGAATSEATPSAFAFGGDSLFLSELKLSFWTAKASLAILAEKPSPVWGSHSGVFMPLWSPQAPVQQHLFPCLSPITLRWGLFLNPNAHCFHDERMPTGGLFFSHTPGEIPYRQNTSPVREEQQQVNIFSGRKRRGGQGAQIKSAIFAISCCLWKRERGKDFVHTFTSLWSQTFRDLQHHILAKKLKDSHWRFKYHSKSVPPVTGYSLPIKIIHSTFDISDYCSFL